MHLPAQLVLHRPSRSHRESTCQSSTSEGMFVCVTVCVLCVCGSICAATILMSLCGCDSLVSTHSLAHISTFDQITDTFPSCGMSHRFIFHTHTDHTHTRTELHTQSDPVSISLTRIHRSPFSVASRPSNYSAFLAMGGVGLDTAYTYTTQPAIGEAIRASGLARDKVN